VAKVQVKMIKYSMITNSFAIYHILPCRVKLGGVAVTLAYTSGSVGFFYPMGPMDTVCHYRAKNSGKSVEY